MLDDLWYFAEAGRELLRAVFCVSGEAWMQADSPGPWPPPRFVHSSATVWPESPSAAMDSSGRFWLFGGPLLSKQSYPDMASAPKWQVSRTFNFQLFAEPAH